MQTCRVARVIILAAGLPIALFDAADAHHAAARGRLPVLPDRLAD